MTDVYEPEAERLLKTIDLAKTKRILLTRELEMLILRYGADAVRSGAPQPVYLPLPEKYGKDLLMLGFSAPAPGYKGPKLVV